MEGEGIILEKRTQALRIVKHHSFFAALAALTPFPITDVAGIGGVQFAMLIRLANLYKLEIDLAAMKDMIIASVSGFITGKILEGVISLAKGLLPGIGQVTAQIVQAPLAFIITYCIGRAFIYFFEEGKSPKQITRAELKAKIQEYKEEARQEFLKSKDEIMKKRDDKEYVEAMSKEIEETLQPFSKDVTLDFIKKFSDFIKEAYQRAKENWEIEQKIKEEIEEIKPKKEE